MLHLLLYVTRDVLKIILCTCVSSYKYAAGWGAVEMHERRAVRKKGTKKCSHHSVHREVKHMDEESAESVSRSKDENVYEGQLVERVENVSLNETAGDDDLNVQELILCQQNIAVIPPAVARYKNLRLLRGCCNILRQIPSFICDFAQLKYLTLSNNMLECLPENIGKLKQLVSLDVSSNRLKELPGSFSALQNLAELNLTNNEFGEIPRVIGCLRTLRILAMEENAINDVPVEIIRLPYLSVLKTRLLPPNSSVTIESSGSAMDVAEIAARRVMVKHLYKKCTLNIHVKRLLMQVKECSFCNGPYFRVEHTVVINQWHNFKYIPVRHNMCSLHFTSEPAMFYTLYIRPNCQGLRPRDSGERLPFSMIFNYHAYGNKLKKHIDHQNESEGTILSLIYHYKRQLRKDQ
ncbi:hypothetical protein VCUG_00283 [Vavraia culicis subsp. floridensis]|uniref:Disease resistance R13L4/SHOC-2-like LRR domain-containing protein n=1 Tax=Vavraia culicis (isolate floridensis) TaxID=948595 RepID=L2GY04_VAVCU|nr:uncharacterized protein VCUG_00283 [Vavraia culicis subsp. floridensis]ELA48242.1 hypothetical protein VCUG_00283 [Vavraia culicis subsp. floridensis]